MRAIGTLLGAVLLAAGLVLAVSPIPLGAVLAVVGLSLLVGSSPRAAAILRRFRRRHEAVDELIEQATDILPDVLSEPIEATEPAQAAALPPIRRMGPEERRRRR